MIVVDREGRIAIVDVYPVVAAHSMDTDWYGIDPAGMVARLQSGEEGSVPYAAHRQYWAELYEDIAIARIDARLPADPDASIETLRRARALSTDATERQLLAAMIDGADGSRDVYRDFLEHSGRLPPRGAFVVEAQLRAIDPSALPYEWDGVLKFASRDYLELFRAEYHYDDWRTLERAGMPAAALARRIQQWAFDEYWNQGAITMAYQIEHAIEPHLVGLYEYGCSFSGPYSRREVPAEPILIDQLPEPLRAAIAGLRVPVQFATTEVIDPERWFDCQIYGA